MRHNKGKLVAVLVIVAVVGGFTAVTASSVQGRTSTIACKRVGKKKVGKSILFHTTVAAVRTRVSFCYNGNRILRPNGYCEVLSHDSFTVTNNGCEMQQGYLAWNGNPYGGYEVQAAYNFGGCIFKYGCFGSYTYNMHIQVYADGTWTHN